MLLMMNYAKNYASSLEKNYQINKQIKLVGTVFLSFEMFVNKSESSSEPEDTALGFSVG